MDAFTITQTENRGIVTLIPRGYLDAHTVAQFEAAIRKLVKNGHYKIIVNMKDLEYISSAGLGVFMGFIEEVREQNGDIKLSDLSQRVYKVFDLLGFPALFEIYEQEKEAQEKFLQK